MKTTCQPVDESTRSRAHLYHFLELALAHPGEDGHDYFRKVTTESEFLSIFSEVMKNGEILRKKGVEAASRFFESMQKLSYEEVESAYIGIFTNNYPHLPCPPYGSLFTVVDSEKRLEEMLAIKQFYQRSGVDIADTFDDLPDHLCVELEFVQMLCFREDEALLDGDAKLATGVQATQIEFMDRFLLPFVTRLTDIAVGSVADNPFSDLLEVTRCLLLQHRLDLNSSIDLSVLDQESQS